MNRCAACRNQMTKQRGDIDMRIGGKLFVLRNIEHEVCEVCGETVFSPKTSQNIYDMITQKKYRIENIRIPVLDCSEYDTLQPA